MANALDQLLGLDEKKVPAAAPAVAREKPVDTVDPVDTGHGASKETWVTEQIVAMVEGVEIEAVVGGALQRIRFKAGTNPAHVGGLLKALDPAAKLRDAFPMRGGGGPRNTELARVLVITVRVSDSGKFIDLVGQNGDDLKIAVSKNKSDSFLDELKALNKVGDKHITKLEKAFGEKGDATVILPESEQFGAKYWKTDDGKAYLDGLQAEPPAAADGDAKEGPGDA